MTKKQREHIEAVKDRLEAWRDSAAIHMNAVRGKAARSRYANEAVNYTNLLDHLYAVIQHETERGRFA